MALKKGDIIDEWKRYPDGCGLVVKVMSGGDGFAKIVCCGHELTAEDVVAAPIKKHGRKVGQKGVGFIIDEKKSHPSSCGLRLMIMDGGQGLEHMACCGHSLTLADEREFLDLGVRRSKKWGQVLQSRIGSLPPHPPLSLQGRGMNCGNEPFFFRTSADLTSVTI